jgi:nitrite reductase (NO-forming)
LGAVEKPERGPLLYLAAAGLIFAFVAGAFVANPSIFSVLPKGPYQPTTRYFTLNIEGADIQEGPNAVWHAWTYNGTVPGPSLHAWIGDKIVVKVINHLNLIHSFHTHLVNYNFTSDGSQANVISGLGAGSMIMPGQSYTYYYNATYAGVFLYHCHSSDQHSISYHMDQGLYGVIVIDDPKNPPPKLAHEWPMAMAEMGPNVTGSGYAPYIMDGLGFPGGEPALMSLYQSQGFAGVAGQLNKTLLAFEARVGETVRFDLSNPGNLVHTFHLHDAELISEFQFPGVPWNDAIVPLSPGQTDGVLVTLTQPGIFLFHCHVVTHADAGMIGVLVVLPASGGLPSQSSTSTQSSSSSSSSTTSTASTSTSPSTSMVGILSNAGSNLSSKGYAPDAIRVVIGVNNTVTWTNNDSTPHTVTSDSGLFDSGAMTTGQSWSYTFTTPGTYHYHCAYHYWMTGTVVVVAGK